MSLSKREQILAATADLIAEQGLQCSPMSKIAKHAGVGAGTIYRYFETKDILIQELYLETCQKLVNICAENYDINTSIRQRFDHIWGRFYQFMFDNPCKMALLDQLWASPAVGETTHQKALTEVNSLIMNLLQDAKDIEAIKPLQNEILLTITFGSLFNIAKKQLQSPYLFSGPVDLNDLLDMCWDAIKSHN